VKIIMLQQPPVNPEKTVPPPGKPADGSPQNQSKAPEKGTAPIGKEAAKDEKAAQPPAKLDTAPVPELQQPVIPLQPPPGAKLAVPPKQQPGNFQIGSILEPALWLIGILTVGALLIAWLKKNKERQLSGISVSPHEQLSAFRDSMEEGEMTEEEFKKVKSLLGQKLKPGAAVAPPATEPAVAPVEKKTDAPE
jgi:hypothetical protein